MSALLLALLAPSAHAESVLEFKTSAPVAIFVDGQQATLTSNLKQRVGGLEPGVHELRVAGVFGKTLYEAEIDIPDGTITTAEWEHGEIKVLGTEWLDDVEDLEDEADEEVAPAEEAPTEVLEVEAPAAPAEEVAPEIAEAPLAIPAEAPVVAPAPPVEPATPVATAEPAAATALASVGRPRTLTVQATDGMRIDVVHAGRTLTVVIEGDTFRIEDPSGAVLALGAE